MSGIAIRDWTKLGSAIRAARQRKRLSQHELAEMAGVSRSWLARVETGHRGAELEQILRLLNALGLTLTLTQQTPDGGDQPESATTASQLEGLDLVTRDALDGVLAAHQDRVVNRRKSWSTSARKDTSNGPPSAATPSSHQGPADE